MMSTLALLARKRWFEIGLKLFAVGALVAVATAALMWLPQLRVIAAIAFVQAALGVVICAFAMRDTQPAHFAALRRRARALGHRMRQAISVERMMAAATTHRG
jgi:hypothetical protein